MLSSVIVSYFVVSSKETAMTHIKDNPPLSYHTILPFLNQDSKTILLVAAQRCSDQLDKILLHLHNELNAKSWTDARVTDEVELNGYIIQKKGTEWCLITENEIYYSRGDSSN